MRLLINTVLVFIYAVLAVYAYSVFILFY